MKNNKTEHKKRLLVSLWLTLFIVIGFASYVRAGTQTLAFSPEEVVVLPGESGMIHLIYNVPDGEKATTGLGLRIHYNSSAIAALSLQDVCSEGLIAKDNIAQDDVDDFDNDPLTDKYVGVAWIGIQGNWPKSVDLPAELGKIILQIQSECGIAITRLNITSSSKPAGYSFEGRSAIITIP